MSVPETGNLFHTSTKWIYSFSQILNEIFTIFYFRYTQKGILGNSDLQNKAELKWRIDMVLPSVHCFQGGATDPLSAELF